MAKQLSSDSDLWRDAPESENRGIPEPGRHSSVKQGRDQNIEKNRERSSSKNAEDRAGSTLRVQKIVTASKKHTDVTKDAHEARNRTYTKVS